MAQRDNFFNQLTRLFRSGPAIQKRIKGQDYKISYDKNIMQTGLGYRGPIPFGRESSPFSMLGNYGILDRTARYIQVSEMEQMAEIGSALDLVSHEVCSTDEKGRNLHIFSDNPEIKKALSELFFDTINSEFNLRPWVRNLLKYGDFFLYNEVVPDIGIVNCIPLPVNEIVREEGYDPNDPAAVRFKWLTRGNKILENWQVCHFRILENDLFLPYGSCLKNDTRIFTNKGIKSINQIGKGEEVSVFDQETQKFVFTKVLDVVNSGRKKCFEIRTKHNFVDASKEHRICVVGKDNSSFEYKNVDEIKIGDKLVLKKEHSFKQEIPIKKVFNDFNKNGYQNSKIFVPNFVTEEFAQLFGFLLGDGWLGKNTVYFAMGVDSEINKKYIAMLQKYIGKRPRFIKPSTKNNKWKQNLIFSQVVFGSKMFVEILKQMEFAGNVYTKRLPNWIFSASDEVKKALIEGIYDSDGSMFKDKWNCERYSLELTNEQLVKDIKSLIQTLGWKTGKICNRLRKPRNGVKTTERSYYFYYFKSNLGQIKKFDLIDRKSDEFVIEPVVSVTDIGLHETWDIHVENKNHNFLANGVVVHNSILEPARRIFTQLTMMEDAMLAYRVVRSPERRVFYIDVGNTAPNDVPNYMNEARAALRSNVITDKQNGRIDYRHRPIDIFDDYYIPKRGETGGTKIETLAGGQHVSAIEDVEYLQKKLFAALKIPKAFLGYSDELGSKATLSQLDIRFSRTVSVYQKIIIAELNKLAMIHLFAKGFDGEDLVDYELYLSNPSSVALQQKLALWNDRIDIAAKYKESGLVDEEWIHKEILEFTNDEINRMKNKRKEDVLYQKELESIAVSDENQEREAVTDPFDPSSYAVPGSDVPRTSPNKNTGELSDDELASTISRFDNDGNVMKVELPPNKSPVQATPYATRRRRNEKRRVGMGGRFNLNNPDFARMLDMSGKNPNNNDVTLNEDEMKEELRSPKKISYEMKKMLNKMNDTIPRRVKNSKILVEVFDEKLDKILQDKLALETPKLLVEETSPFVEESRIEKALTNLETEDSSVETDFQKNFDEKLKKAF